MKKLFLNIILIIVAQMTFAQPVNIHKMKTNTQLIKNGRGSSKVAYQGFSIDQMIYEFMEQENIPGLTLAIVQAPYIPRVVSYGTTNLEYNNLASAKTIFPIGPISQGYTAIAVMQLYEKNKLDIHAPVSSYLKNLPKSWGNITIYELLQHSSGIADYRNQPDFDITVKNSTKKLIESVSQLPLAFNPGTDVQQSATNFLLLAEVVEKVSKMSYRDFITKYQIQHLGLQQTFYATDLDKIKQEDLSKNGGKHKLFLSDSNYIAPSETTQGYIEKDGQLESISTPQNIALKGFSDIWSSAENVSFWDISLAGELLIKKPENRAIIYGKGKLKNGKSVPAMAGWQFYEHKGLMDIKGNFNGHSAYLSRFTAPSELVCVTLLANKEGVEFTNLARKIAGAFDEKLASMYNEDELFIYESQYDVNETYRRIENALREKNIPIFSNFDHGKNANEVGLDLLPNKVIVFGSPKVGTQLMQENPSIAGELPLKITVFEDKTGSVWVSFPQMQKIAERYNIKNNLTIKNMQNLLENLVVKSSSIY